MNRLFDELMESVEQMDAIVHGRRQPARQFEIDALQVKNIRKATGLSQTRFAEMIDVQVATLRNWEQGRREPTGPAKALLRAIHNDPDHVLKALAH
ncbi:NadS family protein [Pseudomonas xantholysinigenes]|jgi:putative transcriptional regulator|uniref:Helix-turn-helix domain-containing protein n=1 Tax=Pseudomonas xantholysinigenes TaxID=2745490 RepID=A0A9E6TYF5_9PSED|nr:NadS family protein [Pseudomonas xantholysinigenes]QXI39502.1 helix-turn-helix domain-containing protein [Pseudomonas xantholysinigenes]